MTSFASGLLDGASPRWSAPSAFDAGFRGTWLKALLLVLPMTSFLAIPNAQGTTPANLLVLLMLFPLTGFFLLGGSAFWRLMSALVPYGIVLSILFLASRYSLLYFNEGLGQLNLINPRFLLPITMTANVTQSLYLLVGLALFIVVVQHYDRSWDRAIFAGAWLMLAYGFIDWFAESAFRTNVDFLANRTFDIGRFEHPGSLRQHLSIFGLPLMRFKSFTGEPSMFGLSALCYLALAIARNRRWLTFALVLALLLSFSATAYLGLAVFAVVLAFRLPFPWLFAAVSSALAVAVLAVWIDGEAVWRLIDSLFVSKLAGESQSGAARAGLFARHFDFWSASSMIPFLFGYGFGTVRSTDLGSSLLVNIGLLGTLAVVAAVIFVVWSGLRNGRSIEAIGLLTVFLLMLAAVPEFAYLPPWLLAGVVLQSRTAPS